MPTLAQRHELKLHTFERQDVVRVGLAEGGLGKPEPDGGVLLGDERGGAELAVLPSAVVLVVGAEADPVLLRVELLAVRRLLKPGAVQLLYAAGRLAGLLLVALLARRLALQLLAALA